jgi:hypothetical protein
MLANLKKFDPPTPDWGYWLKLRTIKLDDAASLTLNVAPEWVPGGNPYDIETVNYWMHVSGYNTRIEILKNWSEESDWLVDDDRVVLYDLIKFLVKKNLWNDLPSELVNFVQPQKQLDSKPALNKKIDWVPLAQSEALTFINPDNNWKLSKLDIAKKVANSLSAKNIYNKRGGKLTAETILRDAMTSVWWEANKPK